MQKFFNTAGPMILEDHYCIPPLERIDWENVQDLIHTKRYFILHAPRQTGKTTTLLEIMHTLNRQDHYTALYANIEAAQAARHDVSRGIPTACHTIALSMEIHFQDTTVTEWLYKNQNRIPPEQLLSRMLSHWAMASPKPIVLFLDEVDALIGDTLISLLRQIRTGYSERPHAFPHSIVLCGVRDVKDYRIHTRDQEIITGGSAFNIKTESIRMGPFDEKETRNLLLQHTQTTGQIFEDGVLATIWEDTQGQPWLVNALAREATHKDREAKNDRTLPIDMERYRKARERLIQSRATHLDQLADKLQEEKVRRIIAAILQGESSEEKFPQDDLQYLHDLGLITIKPGLAIANRIYQEVIPRELTWPVQVMLSQETAWYVKENGSLHMEKLLKAFQQFFREHSDAWFEGFSYKEAGPQLLMQAFLQRIVNGGGRISREYALGRKRTDLFIEWPLDTEKTFRNGVQRIVLELKIVTGRLDTLIEKGMEQTLSYSLQVGACESHLILFNRNPDIPWDEKIWHRTETLDGHSIGLWGC